jgi:hypothetical protein
VERFVINFKPSKDVWEAGTQIKLRSDWETIKVKTMYEGNKAKFEQNPEFVKSLISTKGEILFEHGSKFWCDWNSLIMTRLRSEFRKNGEDEKVVSRIKKLMEECESNKNFLSIFFSTNEILVSFCFACCGFGSNSQ